MSIISLVSAMACARTCGIFRRERAPAVDLRCEMVGDDRDQLEIVVLQLVFHLGTFCVVMCHVPTISTPLSSGTRVGRVAQLRKGAVLAIAREEPVGPVAEVADDDGVLVLLHIDSPYHRSTAGETGGCSPPGRAVAVKPAGDQENGFAAVEFGHFGQPAQGHAAGRDREDGLEMPHRLLGRFDDAATIVPAEGEAAAVVHEDRGVGAGQPRQLAEDHMMRHPLLRADGEGSQPGRMAQDGQGQRVVLGQHAQGVPAGQARRHHDAARAPLLGLPGTGPRCDRPARSRWAHTDSDSRSRDWPVRPPRRSGARVQRTAQRAGRSARGLP